MSQALRTYNPATPTKSNRFNEESNSAPGVGQDLKRSLQQKIQQGPTSLRQRDSFDPELDGLRGKLKSAPTTLRDHDQVLNPWPLAKSHYPYCYQPSNSFQTLQNRADGVHREPVERTVDRNSNGNHIPGYTGFIRGFQHVAGRTFGDGSRRALDVSYRDNVCSSPIPSSPQLNMKIAHTSDDNSFISKVIGGRTYHVPGYTGFVPGTKGAFSQTYGQATEQQLKRHMDLYPRSRQAKERDGFASGMKPRQHTVLLSAPLPGMSNPVAPPQKFIPKHVGNLQFYG